MILQAYLRLFISSLFLLGIWGCCPSYAVPYLEPEKAGEHIETMGIQLTPHIVVVDTQKQTLALLHNNKVKSLYKISTSNRGLGQRINTYRTPQGLHRINEKIGEGVPPYGIFHRRQFIGTWRKQPRHTHLKDYISTRILRLEGLQPGFNKGKDRWGRLVDSEVRGIYIHGTTMEWKLGAPAGKGCVHMSAKDVIDFFNQVPVGTLVWIN